MHSRSSNLAVGALSLALMTAALLSFGSAARADWLVTKDGTAVETKGGWEVKGKTVIFTSPAGVLSSLAASEVNLAASEAHTQKMLRAATSPPEVEAPVKRPAVLILTDADVRHVDPTSPIPEETEDAGETATSPSPRDTGSSLSVTQWDENYNIDENSVEVTGIPAQLGSQSSDQHQSQRAALQRLRSSSGQEGGPAGEGGPEPRGEHRLRRLVLERPDLL